MKLIEPPHVQAPGLFWWIVTSVMFTLKLGVGAPIPWLIVFLPIIVFYVGAVILAIIIFFVWFRS